MILIIIIIQQNSPQNNSNQNKPLATVKLEKEILIATIHFPVSHPHFSSHSLFLCPAPSQEQTTEIYVNL